MVDQDRARAIVEQLELGALPICPLCHLDLAFAIRNGDSRRAIAGITTSTCIWVWREIETELRAQLRRASMKQKPWAGAALHDLDERGVRSRVIRELVLRVATQMADDMRTEEVPPPPLVLTLPRRDG